jgi:hypothetical protein
MHRGAGALASTLRAAMSASVVDLQLGSPVVRGVCGQAGESAVAPAGGFRVLGVVRQGRRRRQSSRCPACMDGGDGVGAGGAARRAGA